MKELREQYGDTQERFIQRLKDDAGYSVSLTAYNRMERGLQAVPRPDMPAIATIDKLRRGPGWLAWGLYVERAAPESVESTQHPSEKIRRVALLPHERPGDGKDRRGA